MSTDAPQQTSERNGDPVNMSAGPVNQAAPCRWCGEPRAVPCMNTRDMERNAIEGEDRCFGALERAGGGEAGMRYVALNREKRRG